MQGGLTQVTPCLRIGGSLLLMERMSSACTMMSRRLCYALLRHLIACCNDAQLTFERTLALFR
jgi:hypothetical protein